MVTYEDVIWMCNPETSRSGVSIEETVRSSCQSNKIVSDVVIGRSCVLYENCMSHRVVAHIILYSQVMNSMNSGASVV